MKERATIFCAAMLLAACNPGRSQGLISLNLESVSVEPYISNGDIKVKFNVLNHSDHSLCTFRPSFMLDRRDADFVFVDILSKENQPIITSERSLSLEADGYGRPTLSVFEYPPHSITQGSFAFLGDQIPGDHRTAKFKLSLRVFRCDAVERYGIQSSIDLNDVDSYQKFLSFSASPEVFDIESEIIPDK